MSEISSVAITDNLVEAAVSFDSELRVLAVQGKLFMLTPLLVYSFLN